MQQRTKRFFLSIITAFTICGSMTSALADVVSDTEKLLNWAQNSYKDLFPSTQPTQTLEPWLYRYYPETGIYAGVNKSDNDVYVLGGRFGGNPLKIDSLAALIKQIDNSGGNTGIPACNTANVPKEVQMSQSGNVVTVTTNGKCVEMPEQQQNICEPPQQAAPTNISVLQESTVNPGTEIKGITMSSGLDFIQALVNSRAESTKFCTMNAPAGTENLIVNTDICLDVTSTMGDFINSSGIPGITITPPVQYFMKSTYSSKVVSDCFNTDATTISDAFTGKVWTKIDGKMTQIN